MNNIDETHFSFVRLKDMRGESVEVGEKNPSIASPYATYF